MTDEELTAKLHTINTNIEYSFLWTVAVIIAWSLAIIIVVSVTAHAASTPKPTPSVTGQFCVSNATGAMRNVLVKNGVVQPCRRNEQLVAIINFDSAPTPAPSATSTPAPGAPAPPSPTPTPTATPTAKAGDPSSCTNCVVDANGTEVGPRD